MNHPICALCHSLTLCTFSALRVGGGAVARVGLVQYQL